MEAEAADAPPGHPVRRDGVGGGVLGEVGVKGGVEAGDRRNMRAQPGDGVDGGQGRRVVQWGQLAQGVQRLTLGCVDEHAVR